MARPKIKNSKSSFNNYGLKPEEDQELIKALDEIDLSAGQVVRALLRQWLKEGSRGVLKYSTK